MIFKVLSEPNQSLILWNGQFSVLELPEGEDGSAARAEGLRHQRAMCCTFTWPVPVARNQRISGNRSGSALTGAAVCIFEALWPQSVSGRAAEEETASDACTQILLPKGRTGIQITSSLSLCWALCAYICNFCIFSCVWNTPQSSHSLFLKSRGAKFPFSECFAT